MNCKKCGQEIKSEWAKSGAASSRLVLICGCNPDSGRRPRVVGGFTTGTPAAYYKDEKTGEMIPVDKSGNVMGHDPYYKTGDYRGWKRSGKSTDGYDRMVHLDEKGNALEEKKLRR